MIMNAVWMPLGASEDDIVKAILECTTPCCVIVWCREDAEVDETKLRRHKAAIRARKLTHRVVSEEPGHIFVI